MSVCRNDINTNEKNIIGIYWAINEYEFATIGFPHLDLRKFDWRSQIVIGTTTKHWNRLVFSGHEQSSLFTAVVAVYIRTICLFVSLACQFILCRSLFYLQWIAAINAASSMTIRRNARQGRMSSESTIATVAYSIDWLQILRQSHEWLGSIHPRHCLACQTAIAANITLIPTDAITIIMEFLRKAFWI